MDSTRFDDLTKALATATSRRQVLRRIGGSLGGTALAGLFPGLAFASNSACANFCNAVFGAETQAAGQCISDAAHGKGLCHTCGSSAPATSICCTRNGSGFCSNYSPALPCSCNASQCLTCDSSSGTCVGCLSGQTCQNGKCVTPCMANGDTCSGNTDCCSGNCCNETCSACPCGRVQLCNGTCAQPCTSTSAECACAGDNSQTTSYCFTDELGNNSCTSDCDCPTGQFCANSGICVYAS